MLKPWDPQYLLPDLMAAGAEEVVDIGVSGEASVGCDAGDRIVDCGMHDGVDTVSSNGIDLFEASSPELFDW